MRCITRPMEGAVMTVPLAGREWGSGVELDGYWMTEGDAGDSFVS